MKTRDTYTDMEITKNFEKKIFEVLDAIRTEGISVNDYDFVVFLLALHKEQIFSDKLIRDGNNLKDQLLFKLVEIQSTADNKYTSITNVFIKNIESVSDSTIKKIFRYFNEIDRELLSEHYAEIFEILLSKLIQFQGRFGGEFIQPIEITRLFEALWPQKKHLTVFNPFAGLASFGLSFSESDNYLGQEINPKVWAIGVLRLIANGKRSFTNLLCQDSILCWPSVFEKYDLIISNPPFGARLSAVQLDIEPGYRTFEQLLIEKGIKSLNDNGTLISLVSQKILFQDSLHERRLRELIVNEDVLDTVISLPANILSNTGVPLSIIILKKKKDTPNFVKFIDASNCYFQKDSRERILDNEQILNIIEQERNSDLFRAVNSDEIRENSCNLSVARYFKKNVEGVKLSKILTAIRGDNDIPSIGKIIKIRDLKESNDEHHLDLATIEQSEEIRRDYKLISESCLLLAIRWKTLKPTIFKYVSEPILISSDILAFRIDSEKIDIEYLVHELNSIYVQEQVSSLRLGTVIPFIRREDLLNVVIKLPSIEEQRAKAQGIKELSEKIKNLEAERQSIADGVSDKLYESVSTIKHSLGKPLLNIGSSLRNIETVLSNIIPEWGVVKINPRYDITMKDTFTSILSNLDLIHSVLRNNTSVFDVSNYRLEEINFLKFIEDYVKDIKSAGKVNLEITSDIHPDLISEFSDSNQIQLISNEELLKVALNTIVENAYMHAFVDKTQKYKLEIRVGIFFPLKENSLIFGHTSSFEAFVKIEVANDGKPFPENYSLEKFVRRNSFAGETGNTGQGGFDLNEIIKYHNKGTSTLRLIFDDSEKGFTTTYSFLIPINR
jgi:type I restriction enzyme M protein